MAVRNSQRLLLEDQLTHPSNIVRQVAIQNMDDDLPIRPLIVVNQAMSKS